MTISRANTADLPTPMVEFPISIVDFPTPIVHFG